MTTVLVVEDEAAVARIISDNLRYEGYQVLEAADSATGLELATSGQADLVLLDLMLPGDMDGFDICRRMRALDVRTPVIMLTARSEERDKVQGLNLGADDYVTKPVGVRELLARVQAVLRRGGSAPAAAAGDEVLCFGASRVDFDRYEATCAQRAVHLSPKAFGILHLLWRHQGRVLSRSDILHEVWGYEALPTTRTVDNHVAELRAALEQDPSRPRYLLTVHGVGYRFQPDGTPSGQKTQASAKLRTES